MRRLIVPLLLFAVLLPAAGCGKSSKSTRVDPIGAQQETAAGNAALAAGDYAGANTHFKAAIAKDPANSNAQFGAAVTEVYLLQADPEIQQITGVLPLAVAPVMPMASVRATRSSALSQRLAVAAAGIDRRYAPPALGRAFFRTLALAADDPDSLSDIQAILRAKVLPKLAYAEDRLRTIEAAGEFRMFLPPSLTDLPDTIEIDLTEVHLLDAVVNGAQGFTRMVCAYNFDVENMDFEHVDAESLFAPGTAFGALNAGGGALLTQAKQDLLDVGVQLDAAATYLTAEADDQSDDVVPQAWLETTEYATFHHDVEQFTATLNGPVTITVDDAAGQPMALQLNLGRFFVPAIADLKTVLPAITITVDGPDIVQPITFGDHPTINGIFPDMTDARWQQLTGLTGATAVALRH